MSEDKARRMPGSFGRFRVDDVLGAGGMGEVYQAFDPVLKRTVAIKTVRADVSSPAFLDRLHREAQACGGLQHPNIVIVYEAGVIDGVVFMVMEHLKGYNLARALERGELSFDAKIQILVQVLDALHYAHHEGVIHRDVKPTNIHLLPDGNVKLLDFGLARVTHAESLTQSNMVVGTPYYASPEQLRGERVDPRTDVFSTGVVAYEMFARRRAFDGDSIGTVVTNVLTVEPPPIQTMWTKAFPEIERIIAKAMAKSASGRYQSAGEMRDALSAFLAGSREAIAAKQAELNAQMKHVMDAATELIEKGRIEESQALLTATIVQNPEASDVRRLFEQTVARRSAPEAVTRPIARSGDDDPGSSAREGHPSDRAAGLPTLVRPTGDNAVAGSAHRRTGVWIAVAAAMLAAVALAANPLLSRRQPATTPATQTATTAHAAGSPTTVSTGSNRSGTAKEDDRKTTPTVPMAPTKDAHTPIELVARREAPKPETPPAKTVRLSAKEMFYGGTTGATVESARSKGAALPGTGLRYRLIQELPNGKEVEVDPDMTFHSGDKVRLAFESNTDGYLYVISEGSSGQWAVLFPRPDINGGRNLVQRFQAYPVPAKKWFVFDANPGDEKLFVLLSTEPLSSLPGFSEPVTKTETVAPAVVEQLTRDLASRDLVIETDKPAANAAGVKTVPARYVVSRDTLGKEVAATIRLIHK